MKNILRDIFSRPIFQGFFEKILIFSLKVMNIGEGQSVENSGEKAVFNILNKISKDKKSVVFDVGAHKGEWLKLFKKEYKKTAEIYSFEPSKISYSELSKIKMDDFHPENSALGATSGNMYLSSEAVGDSTAFVSEIKNNSKFSEAINITTVDEYCDKKNIGNIDLLKIDVEGYELKVLAGAKKMIENGNIKLIQFEFGAPSEEKYTLKDFFDILNKQYTICRILKHGYYPLKSYHHYYEILTVTNFIAIKK